MCVGVVLLVRQVPGHAAHALIMLAGVSCTRWTIPSSAGLIMNFDQYFFIFLLVAQIGISSEGTPRSGHWVLQGKQTLCFLSLKLFVFFSISKTVRENLRSAASQILSF